MSESKLCDKCLNLLNEDKFCAKNGIDSSPCKKCYNLDNKNYQEANLVEAKECFTCKVTLKLGQFHKRKSAKDGHRNKCKGCQKDYHRNYYVDNLEKTLNRVKIYKRNNKTKITNYRIIYNLLNKNTKRSYDKFYRLNNRHLKNSHNAKRRSAKLNAVPKWVNQAELDAITCLYTEARRLEELHGEPYHVDHLIPLIHPLVCGLHCLSNLRVIVAKENLIKGNFFVPYVDSELRI